MSFQVCVAAAGASPLGQHIAMLLAMDPLVKELCIHDVTISLVPAEGIAVDLAHIDRECIVKAYPLETNRRPVSFLEECLKGCSLVLIPSGAPRTPSQDFDDFVSINCGIAKSIVEACAAYCPNAIVGLGVKPGESVVPAMARLYEKHGLDPRRIAGITTVHSTRASKFVHELTSAPIESICVPVVGGFSSESVLPLFSQVPACRNLAQDKLEKLHERIREADSEVTKAKRGKSGATLSMGYAIARFARSVLLGLAGNKSVEYAFVQSAAVEDFKFFTSKVC